MRWIDPSGQRNPRPPADHFYFASLGLGAIPPYPHVSLTVFASCYRSIYNVCPEQPKLMAFDRFLDLGDLVHFLGLKAGGGWIIKRFAPAYRALLGLDLSGRDVNDRNFTPFNTNLEEELARLLTRETPFYAGTSIKELPGEHISHRLFIPVSANGRTITDCMLFSVNERVAAFQQRRSRATVSER